MRASAPLQMPPGIVRVRDTTVDAPPTSAVAPGPLPASHPRLSTTLYVTESANADRFVAVHDNTTAVPDAAVVSCGHDAVTPSDTRTVYASGVPPRRSAHS